MVIFVNYHVPKAYFLQHKQQLKKILFPLEFEVCVLKFENEMNCHKIAKKMDLTVLVVRRLLSVSCKQIRENKWK